MPDRSPFEDVRFELLSGWRAAMLDCDLTVIDRLHLAAANCEGAEILEFPRKD